MHGVRDLPWQKRRGIEHCSIEELTLTYAIFLGGVLHVLQALIHGAPTILVGLFVAGIFQRLLGRENTRRLFGCGTWHELPQAWLIGMILPICSLGAIPVAREMRRAGISTGAILVFAMTAPLFNPISLLYGLTLSEPLVILTFAFSSMVLVTVVGAAWNWLFPNSGRECRPSPPPVPHGLRRMAAIVIVAAREIVGPSLAYIVIGLSGVFARCNAATRQPADGDGTFQSLRTDHHGRCRHSGLRDTADSDVAARHHVPACELRGSILRPADPRSRRQSWVDRLDHSQSRTDSQPELDLAAFCRRSLPGLRHGEPVVSPRHPAARSHSRFRYLLPTVPGRIE